MMNLKQLFLNVSYANRYIQYVILPFLPCLFHEFCHWIVAVFFRLIDWTNHFPTFKIVKKATLSADLNTGDNFSYGWHMCVTSYAKPWQHKFITAAPLAGYIIVGYFAITNGILTTIIYFSQISYFFPSLSDIINLFNHGTQTESANKPTNNPGDNPQ